MRNFLLYTLVCLVFVFNACTSPLGDTPTITTQVNKQVDFVEVYFTELEANLNQGEAFPFQISIPQAGRYQVEVFAKITSEKATIWIEDYINNQDDRTYNVTGNMKFSLESNSAVIDGSPFNAGEHPLKIHSKEGSIKVQRIRFSLLKNHQPTPTTYTQQMAGGQWDLVWSDEFNGEGLPDTSKWNFNIGNWGWGNNELQYYTENETKNVRQENGNLIIEAHKNSNDEGWTSARLTTQGKETFLYGRVEFRAKVPSGRGTWAAGWFLGDDYVDEVSWPYCGEIDVLECVGFEIDDLTGNGLNHATCHTRSYYFKQGNQIGSDIEVENMQNQFHVYAMEWYPSEIKAFVDGVHYYTYDKNANELEWPFQKPQNIVINLAIGGGWGGAKGIDSTYTNHQYILDYIRVYQSVEEGAE